MSVPAIRTILRARRIRGSRLGNPAWRLTFADGSQASTRANASVAYEVGNPGLREGDTVRVEFSAAGTIVGLSPVGVDGGSSPRP